MPSEFGLLSALEELHIYDTGITGTIPVEVASLSLSYAWLNGNSLTGTVPAFDYSSLSHLYLHDNLLTGTIPDCGVAVNVTADCGMPGQEVECSCCVSCGPSGMSQREILQEIYDSTGGASSWIPNNWFGSSVPLCDFNGIECRHELITEIDVRNFGLSGTLPSEIGLLNALEYLIVGFNSLGGTIPSEVYNLSNLIELRLDHTSLAGSISPRVGDLLNLKYLELDDTLLGGSIPSEIGLLELSLELLELDNMPMLQGSLPKELGMLSALKELYVSNSPQLVGSVPTEFGLLLSLEVLWLCASFFVLILCGDLYY